MKKELYESLSKIKKSSNLVTINDLKNKSDRTLLYGYTCERETWHVYIKDGKIVVLLYTPSRLIREVEVKSNMGYIPNKRLYPAKCDFEFCMLLKQQGINLPFTTFEEVENPTMYYGKTLENYLVATLNWIPCETQNPDEGDMVLLTFKNSAGVHVGEALFEYGKYYYIAETDEGTFKEEYSNPLAWMPKPKPFLR